MFTDTSERYCKQLWVLFCVAFTNCQLVVVHILPQIETNAAKKSSKMGQWIVDLPQKSVNLKEVVTVLCFAL